MVPGEKRGLIVTMWPWVRQRPLRPIAESWGGPLLVESGIGEERYADLSSSLCPDCCEGVLRLGKLLEEYGPNGGYQRC